MLHVRLYFGLMENGKQIATSAWDDFVATTVTPLFPDGFTVYEAMGQWRERGSKVVGREPSKVLEVDQRDTRALRNKISEIRAAYQRRFHQQSVGLVTLPACGSF